MTEKKRGRIKRKRNKNNVHGFDRCKQETANTERGWGMGEMVKDEWEPVKGRWGEGYGTYGHEAGSMVDAGRGA